MASNYFTGYFTSNFSNLTKIIFLTKSTSYAYKKYYIFFNKNKFCVLLLQPLTSVYILETEVALEIVTIYASANHYILRFVHAQFGIFMPC